MWRISFLIKIIWLISAKIFKIWQKSFSSLWDNVYYFLSKGSKSSAFLLTACQTSGIKGMAYIYSLSHHSNTVTAMHAFFGDTNPFRFPCRQIDMINNRAVETQRMFVSPGTWNASQLITGTQLQFTFESILTLASSKEFTNQTTQASLAFSVVFLSPPMVKDTAVDPLPTQNFPPPSTSSLATQLFLLCLYQLTLLAFWFGNSPNSVFQLPPWSRIL